MPNGERPITTSIILAGALSLSALTACTGPQVSTENPNRPAATTATAAGEKPQPPMHIMLIRNQEDPRQFAQTAPNGLHTIQFRDPTSVDSGVYVWLFNQDKKYPVLTPDLNLLIPKSLTIATQELPFSLSLDSRTFQEGRSSGIFIAMGDYQAQKEFSGSTYIVGEDDAIENSKGLTTSWDQQKIIDARLIPR